MHITAICDAEGNIASLIASPGNAPRASSFALPGQHEVELQGVDLPDDLPDDEILHRLNEIRSTYRVSAVDKTLVQKG